MNFASYPNSELDETFTLQFSLDGKPPLVEETHSPTRAVRSPLIARLSMTLYVVAISSATVRREPREMLVAVIIALVPIVCGPGLYRLVGIIAALGAFVATALIQLS